MRSPFTPGISALRGYQRGWLRGDVVAGVTVAAYLIPQVMAYAEVAGPAPVVGLWAIMASLLVYTVFGTSRQLSVGPESSTALMTAVAIAPLAAGDPGRYAALAAALALLVGALCVLGRLGRLGFLADLLGVLAAIALSILDLLRRVARPHDGILGYAPGIAGMHDIDDYPDATRVPGLVVYRYDAPISSPTPTTSATARSPPSTTPPPPWSGSCSTQRRTSTSTRPRSTPSRTCAPNWTSAASCSPWPGSNRTCAKTSTGPG